MSIALVVVCRDEQENLEACLASAAPICDRYVIVDTGSIDDTPKIARRWLKDHPGKLHRRRWHGFAHNRTEALELGRDSGADYLLMLDADHLLSIAGDLPELTEDEYMLPIVSGNRLWPLPLLVRAELLWTYRGSAHAYLSCDDRQPTVGTLQSLAVLGGAGASKEKLERDRQVLELEHCRTVFYLARTYEDLGRPLDAIPLYRERAEMGGYREEAFYARYKLGLLLGQHVGVAEAFPELIAAWNMDRRRVEPLRALASLASSVADKTPRPEGLFVHSEQYKERG